MKPTSSWSIVCGLALILVSGMPVFATTPFVITATNVTVSRSGTGSSQFTVTGAPITGSIVMRCTFTGNAVMSQKVPVCPMLPPVAYPVTAGGTVSGVVTFYPPGTAIPAAAPVAGAALVGALLLGLRRKGRSWLALVVLCVAFLAGMTACGGSSNGMSPGTYPYTIAAMNESGSPTGLSSLASTTINVTVP